MNIGDLRHRVTIQALQPVRDDYGAEIEGDEHWVDVCTVWAAVEGLTGRELFTAQQEIAEVDHRVRIRYRRGVKPKLRALLHDGRVFDILAVLDRDGRREQLHLMCREVVAGGAPDQG